MRDYETNLIYTKKVVVSEGIVKELYLRYYLIAREQTNSLTTYGIQVIMENDKGRIEKAFVPDVLSSETGINNLIYLLYSNSVTPVSVYDVIYDCIA
ncbi:DUF6514 family protein [Ruminiclostridium cellulolyticum]|uniref:Uncharacterized protein n=1 Tax=Ruminiclostridium cellulolyticum (strain ATCC 35319 / DSM 5812 / JCM 6584 / H10) TaxID=394503 RepID=B8I6M9_RUMCH|nr:DUF6514 family protein [Ruminiclostridium cellulolyticum]ACL74921.1 hypothetical protein Ccel_0539 [Ruminiclostridium cellulolyticum H10]